MATFGVNISGLDDLLRIERINLPDEFEGAMTKAMEQGEDALKEAINTRGTGNEWTRPWGDRSGSYPGRVDSGDMLNAAKGKVTGKDAHSVDGELGWPEDSPEYISYQDQGFYHVLANRDIEGMMALRDSAELAERVLVEEVENIARKF
ncbi:hypothetical protein SEA_DEJAVU_45 [Microbacterium Phage DejaVu]|nr:hypothetical protein SEA_PHILLYPHILLY_43 [Microbacterium phage PhillyPhilly]WNM66177.1 hypothetical protein SEA_DEJAVU_45 [Microbacterium Phage DejaVu]